jgi:L,D-transpeptidase catalytic domain
MRHLFALPFALALLLALATACRSGQAARQVTVEPLTTPTRPAFALLGGKPETPSAPPGANVTSTDAANTPTQARTLSTRSAPGPTPAPQTSDGSRAPTEGRWIDVDVTNYVVRLMDGTSVVREIAPVAVGAQIDTGEYASTQTGLFHVYNKVEELAYDPPYKTYISHWVGFDPDKANGFHSFLKDEKGDIVDASTGRVSNGCIRTGAPDAIFAFAEVGMAVYVHF